MKNKATTEYKQFIERLQNPFDFEDDNSSLEILSIDDKTHLITSPAMECSYSSIHNKSSVIINHLIYRDKTASENVIDISKTLSPQAKKEQVLRHYYCSSRKSSIVDFWRSMHETRKMQGPSEEFYLSVLEKSTSDLNERLKALEETHKELTSQLENILKDIQTPRLKSISIRKKNWGQKIRSILWLPLKGVLDKLLET